MRKPHLLQRLRRALDPRQERRRQRAERAHAQDMAGRGRGDASTKHWLPGGGGG
jgi:hypothetical protein